MVGPLLCGRWSRPGERRTMALARGTLLLAGAALGAVLTACTAAPGSTPVTSPAAPEPPPPASAAGDPGRPCTLLSATDIVTALGTDVADGEETTDSARQIATCRFATDDMTGIVDVGVSQVDGAESYETNRDLAPAYFGGDPRSVTIPGADKAYLVIAETYDAPVIGMLVGGRFVMLQVGIDGTTPAGGEALAELVASRL